MKIDYHLKILGEKADFSPRKEFINPIEKSKSKIFEITAGNGYGKTFLLNLIGYACFADELDDKYILKSIKKSIARYGDENSYELNYNLNFNLPDGKMLTLKKESHGKRCFKIDGETKFDFKELHNSISILYDVPTNPSERLDAVIKDLGIWNSNLHQKMRTYWEFLRGVQSDFTNIRDEAKICSLEESILELDKEIEGKQNTINQIYDRISQLNNCLDLKKLVQEYKMYLSSEEKLINYKEKFKKLSKPVKINKKDEEVIAELQIGKNGVKIEVESILNKFVVFISESPELLNLIQGNSTLHNSFDSIHSKDIHELLVSETYADDLITFYKSINDLEDQISLYIRNEEMGKKYIVYHFLKQLLEQIDSLIESDAEEVLESITKINSTTLKDEIKKSLILNKAPDYSEIKTFFKERLGKIKSLISELFKLNNKLIKESDKKGLDSQGDRYYKVESEIKIFKIKLKDKNKEINSLKYTLSQSMSIDVSLLDSYEKVSVILSSQKKAIDNKEALNDLNGYLKLKNDLLRNKKNDVESLEKSKKMSEARLGLEQKKSTSKFTLKEQNNINNFIRSLGFLIQNLGNFNELISSINSGDLSSFKDQEDEEFIKIAGRIIAYSMDNKILRPDGEYIQLENYDMLKKEFHCENDITIKKEDVSTGLASATYLKQRIDNMEGDYLIILLDEIGNMANDTLSEVIKSIKKTEDQDRLVLSLLTQPSSEGIKINEF